MSAAVRPPAVAGRFYPAQASSLRAEIGSYIALDPNPAPALGCVAPHAGYMYSGHVAGAVYARLAVPRLCIVLCPNHTGMGVPLSIMSRGSWRTPLGDVPLDGELAAMLMRQCPQLQEDALAHRSEHGAEVHLPFLQFRQPDLRFVPIALGTSDYVTLERLGAAIAQVLAAHSSPVLVIASSDMNHYEPDALTRVKDGQAIDRMLALDARGLYQVVMHERISMCGFGPAVAMMTAAVIQGATTAELVKYATSGDVSGNFDTVVGYAGMIFR